MFDSLPKSPISVCFPCNPPINSTQFLDIDDSPEDLRYILRALLSHGGSLSDQPCVDEVSALARLGHKYQIHSLLDNVAKFLQDHFCTDFNLWSAHDDLVPTGWKPVHAIGVVNIARLLGCPSILPTALAVCCAVNGTEMVRGYERADGTRETLCTDDIARCADTARRLSQGTSAAICHAFATHKESARDSKCSDPKTCGDEMHRLLCAYADTARDRELFTDRHPFRDWKYYLGTRVDESRICEGCNIMLRDRFVERQRELWDRLPAIVGVMVEG
ncbi:hypothetical protein L226DRAFT_532804 [Lentinus tigrinus ALCF2SS1-7]|nr:hypothetical protein L226DRAFT_532804 [Lentinus tigrinus ALCF2SS1-7]